MQPSGCAHSARPRDTAEQRLLLAVAVAVGVASVEWLGGAWAGSLALLADAGHMALDVGALLATWLARRLARRPASWRAPFGWRRLEVVVAFANGLSLLGMAAVIAQAAFERARAPGLIDVSTMAATATFGFVANLASLRLLHGHAHDIGMRGAFLHLVGDAANSLAVVVGAAGLWWFQTPAIDTAVSVLIALVVAASSLPLMGHAAAILLQLAPTPEADRRLADALSALPAIASTTRLQVWRINGHETVVTATLRLAAGAPHEATRRQAKHLLQKAYPDAQVTLELEAHVSPPGAA